MAARTTTKKTDAAGRRAAKKGEPQFANYADKEITPRIQEFAAWLTEQTGYEVDPMSVYLGSALRGTFQKSDENQKRMAERAAEIEQEKLDKAAKAEERAAAKAEREAAKAAKAEAKAAEPKKAPARKSVPAAKGTAAKKAPAKTATTAKKTTTAAAKKPTTTRRRPAAAAKAEEDF